MYEFKKALQNIKINPRWPPIWLKNYQNYNSFFITFFAILIKTGEFRPFHAFSFLFHTSRQFLVFISMSQWNIFQNKEKKSMMATIMANIWQQLTFFFSFVYWNSQNIDFHLFLCHSSNIKFFILIRSSMTYQNENKNQDGHQYGCQIKMSSLFKSDSLRNFIILTPYL